MSNQRWIALHCGEESDSLVRNHPNAFLLLTQIAMRAKWKDCPITKLKAGQAFVGDWKNAGLHSEMAYRHAKKVLTECYLATFKGTSKGTVANLSSSMIFSYSAEPRNGQDNRPATDQQQTRNGQGTTNHTDTQKHGYTEHTVTTKEEPPFSDMFANTQPSQPSSEILPEGWQRLSQTEKGRKKVLRNTPLMVRIGKFFGQRESTLWTIADYIALQDVLPSDEDLDLIESHYSLELENNGYRITCIQTLLNQWPKARSKAAIYFSENPTHR